MNNTKTTNTGKTGEGKLSFGAVANRSCGLEAEVGCSTERWLLEPLSDADSCYGSILVLWGY